MSKSIKDKIKEIPSIYEQSLYSGRNESINKKWLSGLDATHMSEFITSNNYEWGFIFFRALLENQDYKIQVDLGVDETNITEHDVAVVMRHWGDVSKEFYDYDWDDLAELFEMWCKDNC